MDKKLEEAKKKLADAPRARARKPQVNVELTTEEKELFERIATKRGVKIAALIRLLVLDEGRRLGIE